MLLSLPVARWGTSRPPRRRTGRRPGSNSHFQRRPGDIRQQRRRRDRERRRAHATGWQLSRSRPGRVGAQVRPGLRQGQCRRGDAARRQADRRQCPTYRHAARRHHRQSDGRPGKRREDRRPARHPPQWRLHAHQRHLFAVPGDDFDSGCPKRPSWAITAARVIDDPNSTKIRFEGGRLQLFGINLPLLPVFNIARGTEGTSGLLVPDIAVSSRNGFELALPYHWQIGPNRDATITPHLYTSRSAGDRTQISGAEQPRRVPARRFPDLRQGRSDSIRLPPIPSRTELRGYFDGNGRWQLESDMEHHHLDPGRDGQDGHSSIRPHQRRPATQRHQRRADHARQLHLDRRLGVSGASRR